MGSHRFWCFAGLLIVTAMAYSNSAAEAPAGDAIAGAKIADSETDAARGEIRAVLARNRAAREAVTSYAMRITWEQREFPTTPLDAPLPEGTVISYGEGVWVEAGEKFRVHRTKRWERETSELPQGLPPGTCGPDLPMAGKEYSTWAVYNGDYFALHNQRAHGQIYLFPQKVIDAGVADPLAFLFPYPRRWGFGFGSGYVDTEYEKGVAHDSVQWAMERFEAADGPKIRLTRRLVGKTQNEFVLDPERDYLVVASRAWGTSDTPVAERAFQLREWPCGRWYPGQATVRGLDSYHRYTFDEVRFNEPVEDATFDYMSFDMDYTKASLRRRDSRTAQARFLYRDGEWIPETLVPLGEHPPRVGDEGF